MVGRISQELHSLKPIATTSVAHFAQCLQRGGLRSRANSPAAARALNRAISDRNTYWRPQILIVRKNPFLRNRHRVVAESPLCSMNLSRDNGGSESKSALRSARVLLSTRTRLSVTFFAGPVQHRPSRFLARFAVRFRWTGSISPRFSYWFCLGTRRGSAKTTVRLLCT
jgi:hypothetical protein